MKPQLLKDLGLGVSRMKETLMAPEFCVQQKVDGQRLLIQCSDKGPVAYSRNGEAIWNIPKHVKQYFAKYKDYAFDGEYIPNTGMFWVFDCIPADNLAMQYIDRLILLEEMLIEDDKIVMLPTALSVPDKTRLARAVVINNGEGLVFKSLAASYVEGGRSGGYKYKFYNDLDCFVTTAYNDGKFSCDIAVYDEGEEVSIGSVLASPNIHVEPGDVLLVKYLYASNDNKLYQPAILNKRHDKTKSECTLDQLHYTCPDVLDDSEILRLGSV